MRPHARAWERELLRNRDLWRLPGKFGASFDAGDFPLGVETDLNFAAVAPDAFVVRLGGAPDVALGTFAGDQLIGVALRLAQAFLALRETPARRMRDTVAAHGVAPFARAAGLASINAVAPPPRARADWISAHALADAAFVGVALPFGRIDAADLAALAKLAEAAGAPALRLTPWRAILLSVPSLAAARGLAEAARRLPLILDPDDPLLAVAACPGAPACVSGYGPTRELARRLAPLLPRRGDGVALHVSGCAKGCAHPAPAPLTVVAAETGYDVIVQGRADAAPALRARAPEALELMIGGIV
jgi:precorrin-3B synthase